MDSLKNHKWASHFKVSQKDFEKWQKEQKDESFLMWSLQNKVINRKEYFSWATSTYSLPLLQGGFFECNLIAKKEWEKLSKLRKWSQELLPVWMWDNTIFVACLEPPKDHKDWGFKHRIVLATDLALRSYNKHIASFTQAVVQVAAQASAQATAQAKEKTEIQVKEKTNIRVLDSLDDQNIAGLDLELPGETKPSEDRKPHEDLNVGGGDYPERSDDYNLQLKKEKDLKSSAFQKEKVVPVTPYIPAAKKDNVRPITPAVKKEESAPVTPAAKKEMNTPFQKTENEDTQFGELTNATEATSIRILKTENYEKVFQDTKKYFSSAFILKNKGDELFPIDWVGCNTQVDRNKPLVNLNNHSIFKILQKGHPYHGFVFDSENNKNFFNSIGWSDYPKHVSAISISKKGSLDLIFVGLSHTNQNRQAIQEIEQVVASSFDNMKKNKKEAA